MITVYGTAKKPAAPAPKIRAGTATKVYAVYRSPPIRNQVIHPPKLRPPSPHSSRWAMSFGARHRAATKPMALTNRKRKVNTMISVMWSLIGSPPGHPVDDRRGRHAEQNERELQPVERREAPQPRRVVVEQRSQQRHHDGDDEQPVPGAAIAAHRPRGHRGARGHRGGRFGLGHQPHLL